MIFIHEYFVQDIKTKLKSLSSITEIYPVRGEIENFVMVMPIQGRRSRYYTDSTVNLSIVIQDINDRVALENAMQIYDLYRDQVNRQLTLPVDYEPDQTPRSIVAKYIEPVDHPIPLGDQGNGRYQYSLNFLIHLKEN